MAVFRIAVTEDEQRVVNAERDSHPAAHVRRKMLVVWLLHYGLARTKAAEIAGLSRPTVQRYVAAYRTGGLDGLRRWGIRGPVSDLVAHTSVLREALTNRPVRRAADATEQIQRLTGLKRQPTQIRQFLRTELGFHWRRIISAICTHVQNTDESRERVPFRSSAAWLLPYTFASREASSGMLPQQAGLRRARPM
jgi:transposase